MNRVDTGDANILVPKVNLGTKIEIKVGANLRVPPKGGNNEHG